MVKFYGGIVLWFVIGLCVTGIAKHRHRDWFLECATCETYTDPDYFTGTASVVVWPLTMLVLLTDEILRTADGKVQRVR